MISSEWGGSVSPDDMKALYRLFMEGWNCKDFSRWNELCASSFAFHSPTYGSFDLEGYKKYVASIHASFPDAHVATEDLFAAEGNRLVARMTFHGTDRGGSIALGTPPTGKQVAMSLVSIIHIEGGRIAEAWQIEDALGLIKQLKG